MPDRERVTIRMPQSESSTYSMVGCCSSPSDERSRIFFDNAAARTGRRDAPELRAASGAASSVRLSSSSLLLTILPFLGGPPDEAFEATRGFILDAVGAGRLGLAEKKSSIVDGAGGFDFLLAGWTFNSSPDELGAGLLAQIIRRLTISRNDG
jgi:hypothetical protein